MTMDMDPETWRRQQRTRRILVAGAMVVLLAVVFVVALNAERSKTTAHSPPASAGAATASGGGSTSAPSYPDPFLSMTPAGIEALDEEGLCRAMCRTHLQCYAFRRPDQAGGSLERMLSSCDTTCKMGDVVPHHRDPKGERAARDCLKKLECTLFEECVFGAPGPSAPPIPRASAPPTAPSAPAYPEKK
jgi:hypothetical protein